MIIFQYPWSSDKNRKCVNNEQFAINPKFTKKNNCIIFDIIIDMTSNYDNKEDAGADGTHDKRQVELLTDKLIRTVVCVGKCVHFNPFLTISLKIGIKTQNMQ